MAHGPPFQPHNERLDQGDVLTDVRLVKWTDGEVALAGGVRVVVTSNGCTCEDYERVVAAGQTQKAAKMMVQVAPLRPATNFPQGRLEEIRSGKHLDFFYVYGKATVLPDHVVDVTREQPVPAHVLAKCAKVARLAEWQWQALLIHLTVSRFHQEPADLFRDELLGASSDQSE